MCQQRKTKCKKNKQTKQTKNKDDESCRGKIDNHNLYHEFEQFFTVSLLIPMINKPFNKTISLTCNLNLSFSTAAEP